jgi:hypothetical protein
MMDVIWIMIQFILGLLGVVVFMGCVCLGLEWVEQKGPYYTKKLYNKCGLKYSSPGLITSDEQFMKELDEEVKELQLEIEKRSQPKKKLELVDK